MYYRPFAACGVYWDQVFRYSFLLLGWATLLLRGQDAEPIFSTGIKVVNTLATVQNRSGELIKDLKQDDLKWRKTGVRRQSATFHSSPICR
jgi:hypothetical protein